MKEDKQDLNRAILRLICAGVEKYPNWDFHKILKNLEITLPDGELEHESSFRTLVRIEKYKETLRRLGVVGSRLVVSKTRKGDKRVLMVTDFGDKE